MDVDKTLSHKQTKPMKDTKEIPIDNKEVVVTKMKLYCIKGDHNNCLSCSIGSALVCTKLNHFKSLAGKISKLCDKFSKVDLFQTLFKIVQLANTSIKNWSARCTSKDWTISSFRGQTKW